MKKIVLVSLLIASLFAAKKSDQAKIISSDIQTTIVEFNLDDFDLVTVHTTNGIMQLARFKNGASILKKGAPDIHKFSRSIIIPDNGNMNISIINAEYEEVQNIKIAPSKCNLTRDVNPASIPYTFGKVYKKDKFYPGNLAELDDPYILRDFRGQVLQINPFQYRPLSKKLLVYNYILVKVEFDGQNFINAYNNNRRINSNNI